MHHTNRSVCLSGLLAASMFVAAWTHADGYTAVATGYNDYQIWRDGVQLSTIETRMLGPGWSGARFSVMPVSKGGKRVMVEKVDIKGSRLTSAMKRPNPRPTNWRSRPAPRLTRMSRRSARPWSCPAPIFLSTAKASCSRLTERRSLLRCSWT